MDRMEKPLKNFSGGGDKMISWIWSYLIGGFLISHGLLHWRFDLSRSWLLMSAGLGESVSVSLFLIDIGILAALLWANFPMEAAVSS